MLIQVNDRIQMDHIPKSSTFKECVLFNRSSTLSLPFHYYLKQIKYMNKVLKLFGDKAFSIPRQVHEEVQLRFLQASPLVPFVDIYINNKQAITELSYKQVSCYLALPPGKCQIHIYPSGSKVEPVLCEDVYNEPGNSYTLAVLGRYHELQLYSFVNSSKVPPGEAKIRFIHLAPETSTVDLAVKDRDIVFPQISFTQATEYLGLTPMTIDLELRKAGSHEIILPLPKLRFKGNYVYSIFLIGLANKQEKIVSVLLED